MSSLNDAAFNFYRLSPRNLLAEGRLYTFDVRVTVGSGGDNTLSFVTLEDPVEITNISLEFTGTTEALIEGFAGGAVSGGTEITEIFPRNHNKPNEPPFVPGSVFTGRSIDVAGTKFADLLLLNPSRSDVVSSEVGGVILRPDTLYYFTLTNGGNQSGDFYLSLTAAQLF